MNAVDGLNIACRGTGDLLCFAGTGPYLSNGKPVLVRGLNAICAFSLTTEVIFFISKTIDQMYYVQGQQKLSRVAYN